MRYSWKIGLPFILAAATGALSALLTQLSAYHPATTTQAAMVGAALLIGDAIRSQLLIAEKQRQDVIAAAQTLYPLPTIETTEQPHLLSVLPPQSDAVTQVIDTVLRDWTAKMNVPPADPPPQ